uniref:Uncharacterized protein n=1 Tax=Setaria italica TaxID=4555 RepID=K3ZBJ6_SETIT
MATFAAGVKDQLDLHRGIQQVYCQTVNEAPGSGWQAGERTSLELAWMDGSFPSLPHHHPFLSSFSRGG